MTKVRVANATVAALLVIGSLTIAGTAHSQEGPVDLLSQYDIRIDGGVTQFQELAGNSIDGGGDVNDDGVPDIILGTHEDVGTKTQAGRAFVIFGNPNPRTIDLDNLGTAGFAINGAAEGDSAAVYSVAIAGDVNDDGMDDVVVGAPNADNNSREDSGSAYVVFGKTTTTNVSLASLGAKGFRIDGAVADDLAGTFVAAARDVNNDGLPDIAVGAPDADVPTGSEGAAYVVFGKTTTSSIDLASLGAGGFRMLGDDIGDQAGAVAGVRDVNDDGFADVVVGASGHESVFGDGSGVAYVVFGKATTEDENLGFLTDTQGYEIVGQPESFVGGPLAGVRDVNGDGLADVMLGASTTGNNGRDSSGSAYVVFGKDDGSSIDLDSLGNQGYRIDGASGLDFAGADVAWAGDVNDDGTPDMIVGAPGTDNNSRVGSGSAYVLFGKADTGNVDLASLGTDGFRIDGSAQSESVGKTVARAGDLNFDGLDDVVVGAPLADLNGRNDSGVVYIDLVADWLPGACANPRGGSSGDDTLIGSDAGDDITGGAGNDTLRGENGDDCVSGESGEDDLFGGEDGDVLVGGTGGDTLQGDDAADTLRGEEGDDTLDGNAGDDDLQGDDNKDTIEGDDGDDTVAGGGGDDTVQGNDGHDTIEGEDGKDDLKGEKATDTLVGGDKADTLDGGKGDDTLEGEAGEDTLKGNLDEDILKGGDGDDSLKGEDGKDTLKGGDGKDSLTGGDGKDDIQSGDGDDEIFAKDGEKDTIDCGSGSDTVHHDSKDVLSSC